LHRNKSYVGQVGARIGLAEQFGGRFLSLREIVESIRSLAPLPKIICHFSPLIASWEQRRELIVRHRRNAILVEDFDDRKDLTQAVDTAGGGIGFGGSIQRA
jgi:hypothetical protein